MRSSVIVPFLLSSAALILSLLVLRSGYEIGFLNSIYLLKINTSNIKPSSALISNALPPVANFFVGILPKFAIDHVTETAAKKFGIRDFYIVHITTYCEGFGFSKASASGSSTNAPEEQITYCSDPNRMFTFGPKSLFEAQLVAGITIDGLKIPEVARTGIKAIAIVYKLMFSAYILGISLAGLLVILTLLSGWLESRLVTFFIGLCAYLGLFMLTLASVIGTAIAIILREAINQFLVPNLNVNAESSAGYLGMTWAAVGCLLVVAIGVERVVVGPGEQRGGRKRLLRQGRIGKKQMLKKD